ncbi:hypothetical protein HDV00_002644 [Rhizophlyctis rosea]|nr:hypothetical protein HDV00_002644 [Rhizophlyctis rosea]
MATNLCLSVQGTTGQRVVLAKCGADAAGQMDGTNYLVNACSDGSKTQQFQFNSVAAGGGRIMDNITGVCMDTSPTPNIGTFVIGNPCQANYKNQLWTLSAVLTATTINTSLPNWTTPPKPSYTNPTESPSAAAEFFSKNRTTIITVLSALAVAIFLVCILCLIRKCGKRTTKGPHLRNRPAIPITFPPNDKPTWNPTRKTRHTEMVITSPPRCSFTEPYKSPNTSKEDVSISPSTRPVLGGRAKNHRLYPIPRSVSSLIVGTRYAVVRSHVPESSEEVEVKEGGEVVLLGIFAEGWVKIRRCEWGVVGREGAVPVGCLGDLRGVMGVKGV